MKIFVDENIPFAFEAFGTLGEVVLFDGTQLKPEQLEDIQILIVRSVTKVNSELLKFSKIKFVGTATIGFDHIDLDYLEQKGVYFSSAKGCNSQSVAEYVFSAISTYLIKSNKFIKDISLGIVGLGNIGKIVNKIAGSWGIKTLINDPPLLREGILTESASVQEILKCDIITLHVPLQYGGEFNTYHLLGENQLQSLSDEQLLINSSRGGVIDNQNLLKYILLNKFKVVLDVWENEPKPKLELIDKSYLATPHIAGYSFEGKVNGTKQIYDKLCEYLNVTPSWTPSLPGLQNRIIEISESSSMEYKLFRIYNTPYDIVDDSTTFRNLVNEGIRPIQDIFNTYRKNYPVRRELSNYKIVKLQ